jgi:hypothetical protein
MKAKKCLATALLLVLLACKPVFPFEEVSSRITSLGIGFVGFVPDPYTDILRNPAYLTELEDPLFPLTLDPETAYRLGIFLNPTPFLSRSMGGAVVTLARDFTDPDDTSLKMAFPLEYFSPNDVIISTGTYLPPHDLLGSGRDFLVESTSRISSVRSSFSYAVALSKSLSFGVNVLTAENAFDPKIISREENISGSDYGEGYTSLDYSSSSSDSDNEETLTSLRFGILKDFSETTSLDFEVTASRSNASAFTDDAGLSRYLHVYPDSTTMTEYESVDRLEIEPLDKEVIEGNLFVHRHTAHGRMSFRMSFFSGDAVRRDIEEYTRVEGGLDDYMRKTETVNDAGWSGGLLGMSGSRSWKDGTLDFTFAGFYGFMRARNMKTVHEEKGISVKTYRTVHQKNRWDSHFTQLNLGAEYKVTPSVSALLGGRATGIFINSDWEWTSLTEAEGFTETSEEESSNLDLKMNAGITGGAAFKLSDWITLSLYTPDLADLSSWHLESLITF